MKNHKHKNFNAKKERFDDVEYLQERIKNETPKTGQYFYDYKLEEANKDQTILEQQQYHRKYKINFSDLPISSITVKGLSSKNFNKMTEVQRCVIPHALLDRDVMAASRTGSGKTLAYLIPLVQKLYRNKFIAMDGLGALVIVPVRQLAIQVFEVLNSFTKNMEFNIGLIIGGKDFQFEKQRIGNMNILISTPGRLLQHLQESYGFETTNLQMLVLDEADVMMQMGFKNTLNAILSNLPKCQTLLFSATLSKSIYQLADLSLNQPQKVFLHGANNNSQKQTNVASDGMYDTPAKLTQYYMQTASQQKLNTLYSFLKCHPKQKILVFVSTCKQARFIYQAFKKFRFGCPMYQLQGHQKQKKRMAIYFTFCEKQYGILISTNIASRGLDFPMIDWVIQLDIPEDVETYVHRVGRTARFKAQGKSLLLVTPSESQFINNIKANKILINKITQNPQRYFRIQSSLQSICSQHQDIKYLAQRAVISYLKSVYKASNKKIFNIKNINSTKFAQSYGIANAPIINIKNEGDDQDEVQSEDNENKMTKIEKLREKTKLKKQLKKQKQIEKNIINQQEQEQGQQIIQVNRNNNNTQLLRTKKVHRNQQTDKPILSVSKRQLGKIKNEGHFDGKNKIYFTDDLKKVTDEQFRRNQYLANNKYEIDDNRVQQLQRNKINNQQSDRQYELQRRKMKRKKIKQQKQQLKSGRRNGSKIAVLESQGQEQYQQQ